MRCTTLLHASTPRSMPNAACSKDHDSWSEQVMPAIPTIQAPSLEAVGHIQHSRAVHDAYKKHPGGRSTAVGGPTHQVCTRKRPLRWSAASSPNISTAGVIGPSLTASTATGSPAPQPNTRGRTTTAAHTHSCDARRTHQQEWKHRQPGPVAPGRDAFLPPARAGAVRPVRTTHARRPGAQTGDLLPLPGQDDRPGVTSAGQPPANGEPPREQRARAREQVDRLPDGETGPRAA